jgi:preprotein translocase subunit SecF
VIKSPTAKRKIFFTISIVLIVISIASLCFRGLNFGIDFTGGTTIQFELGETKYSADVETRIREIVKETTKKTDITVQKTGENGASIKTVELTNEESEKLTDALMSEYKLEQKVFSTDKVSGSVSGRLITDSLKAIALAVVLMLLYITWRFDFRSGTSAVLALVHDVIIMLGFYSIFQFTVSTSFIAAVLTIVGYSINATIIVFDRVREKSRVANRNVKPDEIADEAVTNSYYRAINSSVTTLLTIGALYVMGVDSIREFALPIIIGILAGTYSSLFIAAPFWAWWKNTEKK